MLRGGPIVHYRRTSNEASSARWSGSGATKITLMNWTFGLAAGYTEVRKYQDQDLWWERGEGIAPGKRARSIAKIGELYIGRRSDDLMRR